MLTTCKSKSKRSVSERWCADCIFQPLLEAHDARKKNSCFQAAVTQCNFPFFPWRSHLSVCAGGQAPNLTGFIDQIVRKEHTLGNMPEAEGFWVLQCEKRRKKGSSASEMREEIHVPFLCRQENTANIISAIGAEGDIVIEGTLPIPQQSQRHIWIPVMVHCAGVCCLHARRWRIC